MQLNKIVQVHSIAGEPVTRAGVTVTPRAQAIRINGFKGRLTWVRPTSVLVERNGSQESLPILDLMSVVILVIAVLSLIINLGSRPRRNWRNENV